MREKAYNIKGEGERGGGDEGSEKMYTPRKGERVEGQTDGKGGRPITKGKRKRSEEGRDKQRREGEQRVRGKV